MLTTTRTRLVGLLLAALVLTSAGCIGAMQTTAHEPTGSATLKPTVTDKDAGLVGIMPGFDLKRYRIIAIERFPVNDPEVKSDEDRKMAALMPDYLQTELVRRLRAAALFGRVVNLSESPLAAEAEPVLRVEGSITRLEPGSRALRYLVGFGAGRTQAQAEMRFVDVQTGQVVMVTADRRVAAYGVFGGDSEDHLRESFGDMARDLAKFLERLSKGQAPRQD